MFWDNRVKSLENQAMEEMRGLNYSETSILKEVVSILKSIPEYKNLFKSVFNQAITIDNIAKAIVTKEL